MLLPQDHARQVARYFYQILALDLTNHARSVEESVAFCVSLLRGLQQVQTQVLRQWLEDFDQLLPEISSPQDFAVAVRMARILEHKHLDAGLSERLLEQLAAKITDAMRVLPDDLWRVRVLAQLTQQCISDVFGRLEPQVAESIKYMSHNTLGGDKILKAIGADYDHE